MTDSLALPAAGHLVQLPGIGNQHKASPPAVQALRRVLDAAPLPFSLELASLAAVRQVLSLEDWVGDYYTRDPRNTVIQLLTFLEQRALVGAV
jgi:hypothetical protein